MTEYYLDHENENAIIKKEEDGALKKLSFIPLTWQMTEQCSGKAEPITEEEVQKIIDTFLLTKEAHEGQTDKSGKPYIEHPLRVSRLVQGGIDEILTALLHDAAEDTAITLEDLRAKGYPDRIVDALDCVTKRDSESREEYLKRVASNETARRVKLADLTHNSDLSLISNPTEKDFRRVENYQKEKEYLQKNRI
jgi:(p)ppGpp synthase/HD superfamily hydrolase